jgi:diguanylate cyclase (GGDEF)-like protein
MTKQTILVVDDIPQNIHLLNAILNEEYRLVFATNGPDAIKIASDLLPDIVLLDVMMPDMTGFEVCKLMKEDDLLKDIPIIFVTALGDVINESEGLKLGAIDYIRKPFNPDIVRLRVRNHLELKIARDELFLLSNIDKLTGISNRRAIEAYFEKEVRRAIRMDRIIGVLMIDIDFFKAYNDHFGHVAGDACLSRLAGALNGALLRPGDMVGRYGGEEFLCVLPEVQKEGISFVAEKLRKTVEDLAIPHPHSSIANHVTVSIGAYSTVPQKNLPYVSIIEKVDAALYRAKESGRNRVSLAE